jgi:hypothetical protein
MHSKPKRLFAHAPTGRVSRYSFGRTYSRQLTSQRRRNQIFRTSLLRWHEVKSRRFVLSRCVALVQAYFARQRKAA